MRDEFNVSRRMLGGKIDPLSEIRNAGIVTNGSVFWVKPPSDADYTTFLDQVGVQNAFGTIQSAIDKARDDKNDYVLVTVPDSNAVYTLGTSLDIGKDRLHLVAVGHNQVADSYAVTLRGFATTTVDSQMIEVAAGGVEMAGFRVLGTSGTSGGTVTNGLLRVGTASTGTAHDLFVHDTTFENTAAGIAEVPVVTTPGTVHSARFENCWFGNATDQLEGAHAGIVALGAGGKRWSFRNSTFVHNAGSSGDRFVTTGTGAKVYTIFKNCEFLNLGTVALASGFVGSVTTTNPVYVISSAALGVTALGTDPTVYAVPQQSGTAGAGVHNPYLALRGSAAVTAA